MNAQTKGDVNFHRLLESAAWGEPIDVVEYLRDVPGFGFPGGQGLHATQLDDRTDGRHRPVYGNEIDLKIIRALSWLLFERVPMARAWVERLQDYTIGTGFDWTIVSKENPKLAARAKVLLDRTLKENRWTEEMERETYEREVVDGEAIIELQWCDGAIHMNMREGDELTEPARARELEDYLCDGSFESSWTFGVHTRKERPGRPIGYHFVSDPAGGDWVYAPACHVVHWKRNVRSKSKRGYGDFYTPHQYLMKGDKVFTNTADGTATQAAISFIVKHLPTTTSGQASGLAALSRYVGRTDPITGATERNAVLRSGTRLDIKGQEFHYGPLGTNNSQIYVAVMTAAMQLAGTIKAFPDGMLTGATAGGNFASSLVAVSPFVQGRVSEQNVRANRTESLLWKILGMFCKAGAFKEYGCECLDDLRLAIEIACTPPNVIPIDKTALSQALAVQKQNGWVSDKTAMQELQRDPETEAANIMAEKPPAPPPGAPGMAPGAPGAPAPGEPIPDQGGPPSPQGSRGEQTSPGVVESQEIAAARRRLVEAWKGYP